MTRSILSCVSGRENMHFSFKEFYCFYNPFSANVMCFTAEVSSSQVAVPWNQSLAQNRGYKGQNTGVVFIIDDKSSAAFPI